MGETQLLACSNSDIMIDIVRAPNLGMGTSLEGTGSLFSGTPKSLLSLTIFEVGIEE